MIHAQVRLVLVVLSTYWSCLPVVRMWKMGWSVPFLKTVTNRRKGELHLRLSCTFSPLLLVSQSKGLWNSEAFVKNSFPASWFNCWTSRHTVSQLLSRSGHEQIPIPDSTKTLTRWDLSSLNKPLLHSLRLFMKHLHYSWELGMSKTKQLASTHPRAHGPFWGGGFQNAWRSLSLLWNAV